MVRSSPCLGGLRRHPQAERRVETLQAEQREATERAVRSEGQLWSMQGTLQRTQRALEQERAAAGAQIEGAQHRAQARAEAAQVGTRSHPAPPGARCSPGACTR
jgi:cell division septum initiation protein DivIVA